MESVIFVWINNNAIVVPNQFSLCSVARFYRSVIRVISCVVNILLLFHSVISLIRVRSNDIGIC
jgi:hypothetical protein